MWSFHGRKHNNSKATTKYLNVMQYLKSSPQLFGSLLFLAPFVSLPLRKLIWRYVYMKMYTCIHTCRLYLDKRQDFAWTFFLLSMHFVAILCFMKIYSIGKQVFKGKLTFQECESCPSGNLLHNSGKERKAQVVGNLQKKLCLEGQQC